MKISVITAVYNTEKTVGEAISSVARQDYRNIEHVVIEGASQDGSLAAVQRASHDRMKLVSEPDAGVYHALNKGISHASGDIIGFVHSDDILVDQDVLPQIAEAFKEPDVEAVYSDLDYVSQEDVTQVVRRWRSKPFAPRDLRWGWMPPHPTLYLRREVYERIGLFDTSFEIAADYDFMLRFFTQPSVRCVHIPRVTYKMRLGGISNRSPKTVLQKMAEDYRAIRKNRIGGFPTLVAKNLSKVGQFIRGRD